MENDNPIPEMSALRVRDDYNLWVADDNGSSIHIFKTDGENAEVFYESVGLTENNCSYSGMNRIIYHDKDALRVMDDFNDWMMCGLDSVMMLSFASANTTASGY